MRKENCVIAPTGPNKNTRGRKMRGEKKKKKKDKMFQSKRYEFSNCKGMPSVQDNGMKKDQSQGTLS